MTEVFICIFANTFIATVLDRYSTGPLQYWTATVLDRYSTGPNGVIW